MLTETVCCKIIWKDLTICNFCYSLRRKGKSVTRFTTQSLISGNYLLTWHCKCTQSYKMLTKNHVYSLKNLGPWLTIWKVYLPLQVQQKPQEMVRVPCDNSKLWAFPPSHSLQSLKSPGKKNKFGFPGEDNGMPALYLSCDCATEVAALV